MLSNDPSAAIFNGHEIGLEHALLKSSIKGWLLVLEDYEDLGISQERAYGVQAESLCSAPLACVELLFPAFAKADAFSLPLPLWGGRPDIRRGTGRLISSGRSW